MGNETFEKAANRRLTRASIAIKYIEIYTIHKVMKPAEMREITCCPFRQILNIGKIKYHWKTDGRVLTAKKRVITSHTFAIYGWFVGRQRPITAYSQPTTESRKSTAHGVYTITTGNRRYTTDTEKQQVLKRNSVYRKKRWLKQKDKDK